MGGYMDGWRSKRPLCDPSKKTLFFIEKMLRLLEIFFIKNSSPFFSKLVRVRGPNHYILLIVSIKPYNICYVHFWLRLFLSEIFDDPFHQTKKGETNKTEFKKMSSSQKGMGGFCKKPLHFYGTLLNCGLRPRNPSF